jgi:zinc transport system substrate-binding protein
MEVNYHPMNRWHATREVHHMKFLVLCSLCVAALLLATGCTTNPPQYSGSGNLSVAVGIPPFEEFVNAVGGDQVRVTVILPPGADPHTFEPPPQDVVDISRADLILAVGSHLPFEDRLLQGFTGLQPAATVVNLSEGITFVDRDPHVWLSLANARLMVNTTAEAFCTKDPAHCDTFLVNRDAYLSRLRDADERIRETLNGTRITTFLVVHPAWGYFARECGLTELAIAEEGKEPSASELAALVEVARNTGVRVVFVEPQFSRREADILAAQINGRVETIDPLARDYIDNLERVAEALRDA